MKKRGWEVYTYERSKGGEKGVDTKLVLCGMNFIQSCIKQGKKGHLYLMSGDFDMKPLIDEALKNNCQVTLISWRQSLSSNYTRGDMAKQIDIIYLDDKADGFIFFEAERKRVKQSHRNQSEHTSLGHNGTSLIVLGGLIVAVIVFVFFILK